MEEAQLKVSEEDFANNPVNYKLMCCYFNAMGDSSLYTVLEHKAS